MTAHADAYDLGHSAVGILSVISKLTRSEFEESVASDVDATEWLDIYVIFDGGLPIYIKFGRDDAGYRLISFHLSDL